MSQPPSKQEEISVEIASLAAGGSCVGSITAPEELSGKKAFIPFTIPGELVTATVNRSKRSYVEASLVSIARQSPHRCAPACPAFGSCGGCDLQHINLPEQRKLKAQMVEDLLRIHGGIEAQDGVSLLAADLPGLSYRRRMSFHINKKGEFGLYRKHGRSIVELTHCPISTDTINSFLEQNISLIKGCAPEVETVTVEDHDGIPHLALEIHPKNLTGAESLLTKEAFRELERRIPQLQVNFRHKAVYRAAGVASDGPPVGHFSQNNKLANDAMIEFILQHVQTESVTDLFAGAGNISIPLAEGAHIVTAVELDPALVAFGQTRAEAADVANRLTFHVSGCEKWIQNYVPAETVVLDPPRSGALEVCQRLSSEVSPYVVYVSCYPPTFARDVQALSERGYYLKSVSVLDMFPQTYHSELVALLEKA
jgi:23S rRNA (uracil1939-C5)-methyltransferase